MIGRTDLENKLNSLLALRDQAEAAIRQAQANFNACEGAVQVVQELLATLDAAEGKKPLEIVDSA